MKTAMRIALFVCVLALGAQSASATSAFGVRGGLGIDPDQGVIGLQSQFGDRKFKILRLAPSVDFGFGDNVTTVCGNLDLLAILSPPGSGGGFYLGGGPTLAWSDFEDIESETEIGLSVVGGVRFALGDKNAYTAEVRFGVDDIPEIRILVGILFGVAKADS